MAVGIWGDRNLGEGPGIGCLKSGDDFEDTCEDWNSEQPTELQGKSGLHLNS